ncbi:hypothetical protein Mpt1_c11780 [Candidatus Methanoplasma termitum]|uniref:Bacterial repeat domain-containing protein n=1 Tax=Candidatus Methanoplasma termitum TaxID=1577791 RepID=A0A0A7LD05_9ARCH|nr:GLUG motif-containing protein [Candidatus Methanoplasma termitum]AIZ57040.1 hypothetical protein Mpt1_c11780 [Candidatus Methanoplasma termitum]
MGSFRSALLLTIVVLVAVTIIPVGLVGQNSMSGAGTDNIPVSTQWDLARVGTGDVYGGFTWSIDASYCLTNDIFITEDLNGGVPMSVEAALSGNVLTVTVSSTDAAVTVTSLYAIIDTGMSSSAAGGTVAIKDVIPCTYDLMLGGTTSDGNFAWSTFFDASTPLNATFDSNGNFTPVGTASPFTGKFDGNGYAIYGLKTAAYNDAGAAYSGLFAQTDGATIQDLGITLDRSGSGYSAAMSPTLAYAGGVVGQATNNTNITDCYNSRTVYATAIVFNDANMAHAGGIAGADDTFGSTTNSSSILRSWNIGRIAALTAVGNNVNAGGIIGRSNYTTIDGCHNAGPVSALSNVYPTNVPISVGGIAGQVNPGVATLLITNSYNSSQGEINGECNGYDARVGGIVGFYNTTGSPAPAGSSYNITKCYNDGSLKAMFTTSGSVGSTQIGGIIGETTGDSARLVSVQECYNDGEINALSAFNVFAGGIIGEVDVASAEVVNCYNAGGIDVTMTAGPNFRDVGGIVGGATGSSALTLFKCYNKGKVSANGSNPLDVGGLIGEAGSQIYVRLCYYLEKQLFKNGGLAADAISGNGDGNIVYETAGTVPAEQHSGVKTAASALMTPSLDDANAGNSNSTYFTGMLGAGPGWDFMGIWTIIGGTNEGYPILQAFVQSVSLDPNPFNAGMNISIDRNYYGQADPQYAQYQLLDGAAAFMVSPTSAPATGQTVHYQWQVATLPAGGSAIIWTDIPGANGPRYSLSPMIDTDSGTMYRAVVTPPGLGGAVESDPNVLYVLATVTADGNELTVDTGFVPEGDPAVATVDPDKLVYSAIPPYPMTLMTAPGTDLPTSVELTMGKAPLAADNDFTYDMPSGEVSLFVPVNGDTLITAVYAVPLTYSLTIVGTGKVEAGTSTFTGPGSWVLSVPFGTTAVKFTATEISGWNFVSFARIGGKIDNQTPVTYTITGSDTITAVFEQKSPLAEPNTYYTTILPGNGSIITPSGRISAIGGDNQTVFFTAIDGFMISEVLIDGVYSLSQAEIDSGSYTFTNVVSNHTIEVKTIAVSISEVTLRIDIAGGNGYAEYSVNGGDFVRFRGAVAIPEGSDITVRAVAADGFEFSKWETPNIEATPSLTFKDDSVPLHIDLYFHIPGDDANRVSDNSNFVVWWVIGTATLLVLVGVGSWVIWTKKKSQLQN